MKNEKKNILLVEDEALIAIAEARKLECEGYTVIIVPNGIAAIQAVASPPNKIDLILMDIDLGAGMDGTEAAREILKNHDIPVVFLSSHNEKEIVDRTETMTSYGYVVKNIDITVLAASIKMAFRLHEANKNIVAKSMELEAANEKLNATNDALIHSRNDMLQQEIALRESERRYRLLVSSLPDIAVLLFDHEHRFLIADGMEIASSAFEKNHIEGHTLSEIFPPDFVETHQPLYNKALAGETTSSEYCYRNQWYHQQIMPVYENDGTIHAGMVIVHNITERKKAQQAIIESEEMFRRIFDQSPIGTAITSTDYHFVRVNEAMCTMIGYSAEEFASLRFREITHPDHIAADIEQIRRLESGKIDHYSTEKRYIRKDGTVLWGHLTLRAVRDTDGHLVFFLPMVMDITERKQAEDALRESEVILRSFFDSPSAMRGIVEVVGDDILHISDNTVTADFFGLSQASMQNQFASSMGVPPDFIKLWIDHYNESKRTGHPASFVYAHRTVAGDRWLSPTVSFLGMGSSGNPRFAYVVYDITELKKTEEELRRLLSEKEILLKELQHRVKNNLGIIESLLSLEMDNLQNAHSQSVFQNAITRIQSMSLIYNQLYTTSSLDQIYLHQYIQDMARYLLNTYTIAPERITLSFELSPITLDIKRAVPLGLILNELVTNAIKYAYPANAAGILRIELKRLGDTIEFSVSDSGPGMPEGFNLDTGKCMGLRLVNLLVTQIGGEFSIECVGGTTARITLKE